MSILGLDYVFAYNLGIYVSCTFYLILYCVWCCNVPELYPRIVLPGLLSGIMWAIAEVATFIGSEVLSLVVTYPIMQSGPGAVAALLSVFIFREIQVPIYMYVVL